jgi:hypothetical protein
MNFILFIGNFTLLDALIIDILDDLTLEERVPSHMQG